MHPQPLAAAGETGLAYASRTVPRVSPWHRTDWMETDVSDRSWILKAIVIVLAVVGLVTVLGVAGMAMMHVGMMRGTR
jgi:hypothetical protein